ncbi:MAG: hypothetical protein R2731_11050 [Nocardioides sp.]
MPRTQPPRDELAIKLALAVTVPGVDVGAVIQQQRRATMAALQDYTRLGARPEMGRSRDSWPGRSCSTRWCSTPRPRSAGWTTARPACGERRPRGPAWRRNGRRPRCDPTRRRAFDEHGPALRD